LPKLTFNLFGVSPDKETVPVTFIPAFSTFLIHGLRDAGIPSAGLGEAYGGLEAGTYALADEGEIRRILNSTSTRQRPGIREISASSYVMKYILSDALAKKLKGLGNAVYLPRDWFEFGTITYCSAEAVQSSIPNGLFVAREAVVMRVEHQDEKLSVELDTYFKRFANLGLPKVLQILSSRGFGEDACVGLKCYAEFELEGAVRRVQGYIVRMGDSVGVMTQTGEVDVAREAVSVNHHFFDARRFISSRLGENVSSFDTALKGKVRSPADKIRLIVEKAKEAKRLLFPIDIAGVSYDLDEEPLVLEISGEEAVFS
jgi:hypothetical protein